jgi:hypothetical protein
MMVHATARGNGSSGSKPHHGGFQNHRGGGRGNGGGGVATLTTYTRTTSARSAVNSATLPSIAGSVLTRAIMALRRWRTRQQLLILLIRHSAWYADSAATDHITSDLDKLSMKEHYGGQNQVHAANGSGMAIKHVGQSMVSTLSRSIILKNVLHVPQSTHNLTSVHRLTSDNDVFLELHPIFFLSRTSSLSL